MKLKPAFLSLPRYNVEVVCASAADAITLSLVVVAMQRARQHRQRESSPTDQHIRRYTGTGRAEERRGGRSHKKWSGKSGQVQQVHESEGKQKRPVTEVCRRLRLHFIN